MELIAVILVIIFSFIHLVCKSIFSKESSNERSYPTYTKTNYTEKLVDSENNYQFEKNEACLRLYFNKFNEKYFEGKLALISLKWFKGSQKHGYFRPKTNLEEHKFEPIEIALNENACGTFVAFRNVFVHEMLHYYVDCYIGLPEQNWIIAEKCLKMGDKAGFHQALYNTPKTCHEYEWKKIADELSKKYPELGNIERYAVHNSDTGVALYDSGYIKKWIKQNIILLHKSKDGEKVYVISRQNEDYRKLERFIYNANNLITKNDTDDKRWNGEWYELVPKEDKNTYRKLTVFRKLFNRYFRYEMFISGEYSEMIERENLLVKIVKFTGYC